MTDTKFEGMNEIQVSIEEKVSVSLNEKANPEEFSMLLIMRERQLEDAIREAKAKNLPFDLDSFGNIGGEPQSGSDGSLTFHLTESQFNEITSNMEMRKQIAEIENTKRNSTEPMMVENKISGMTAQPKGLTVSEAAPSGVLLKSVMLDPKLLESGKAIYITYRDYVSTQGTGNERVYVNVLGSVSRKEDGEVYFSKLDDEAQKTFKEGIVKAAKEDSQFPIIYTLASMTDVETFVKPHTVSFDAVKDELKREISFERQSLEIDAILKYH